MAIAPALLLALITLAQWHCAQASPSEDALSEVAGRNNQSLLWGPYRPNLYFGVRPRLPHSLMTGLLWARVEDFQTAQNSITKAPRLFFALLFFFSYSRRRWRYVG
jgi:mannosyl-oligosaccharide glucosidase